MNNLAGGNDVIGCLLLCTVMPLLESEPINMPFIQIVGKYFFFFIKQYHLSTIIIISLVELS